MWIILKVFDRICYSTASVLCFWFFSQEACRVLSPQPGIEPAYPSLEGKVLTTGLPGESPYIFLN